MLCPTCVTCCDYTCIHLDLSRCTLRQRKHPDQSKIVIIVSDWSGCLFCLNPTKKDGVSLGWDLFHKPVAKPSFGFVLKGTSHHEVKIISYLSVMGSVGVIFVVTLS